jgi:septum site-determining protein MinC
MGTEEHSDEGASEAHYIQGGLEMEEKQSVQGYIAIKGTRNGLLLTLEPETPFGDLLHALADRLAEAPTFFRGASLSVDTSRRSLRVSERIQLEDLLADYQMSVMPLERITSIQKEAKTLSLVPLEPAPDSIAMGEMEQIQRDPRESDNTLFLRRTVRSGQAIHHPSNIVVLGDVNPGAEIIAGGDVIVWGVLRGMVHAGYPDNENALVCALQLSPVQLRIAHLLSRPPEGFGTQPNPEVATTKNGQIIVESWVNGRQSRK